MCNRHQCHNPSLCVTCADHADRHQRHTPLEGVTIVTLVDKVPMPSFYCGGRGAGAGYAFALCLKTIPITCPCKAHRLDTAEITTEQATRYHRPSKFPALSINQDIANEQPISANRRSSKKSFVQLDDVVVNSVKRKRRILNIDDALNWWGALNASCASKVSIRLSIGRCGKSQCCNKTVFHFHVKSLFSIWGTLA
jgi:hypothetical protein